MVSTTRAGYDLELTLADGRTVGLMLETPRDPRGAPVAGAPKGLAELLVASDADTPLSERRESEVTEDWSGGVGVSYSAAEGLYTRTPHAVLPAGAAVDLPLPAVGMSNSPIHALAEYNGDMYVAQFGDGTPGTGRVLRSAGGTGPLTNSLQWDANEYCVDLMPFDDGFGTDVLWATCINLTNGHGRLAKFDGSTWTKSAVDVFGANGRYRLAKVFWVTSDGVGAWRMVAIARAHAVSYTVPNADPLLPSAWVDGGIQVKSRRALTHLVATRRHVYCASPGELFDIDEQGNAHSLTNYAPETVLPSFYGIYDTGDSAVCYLDGYIYTRLAQGLDRINVQASEVQELPGQCGPGWGTPAENAWTGYSTALTSSQGYLVNAVYSPNTTRAGIFWGKDKRYFPDVETRNPLVWFGPEVVSVPGYRVMRMVVSGLGGGMRLWVSAHSGPGVPVLSTVSLPPDGSALQDLLTTGPHRYATGTTGGSAVWQPYCRLYGLQKTYKSRKSIKHVHQTTVGSRTLDGAGTRLVQYTRADAPPGSADWGAGVTMTQSPLQSAPPAAPVSGSRIEQRTDFFAPGGGSTPPIVPVLDLLETTAWRVAPDFDVWSVRVSYGAGVLARANGTVDQRADPDDVTLLLEAASRSGPIAIRDARSFRYQAKLLQVVDRAVLMDAENTGKTVTATLRLAGVTRLA